MENNEAKTSRPKSVKEMERVEFHLYKSDLNEPKTSFWWKKEGTNDWLIPAICPQCHKDLVVPYVNFDEHFTEFRCRGCGFDGKGYVHDWNVDADATFCGFVEFCEPLMKLAESEEDEQQEEIKRKLGNKVFSLADAMDVNREYSLEEFYSRYKKACEMELSKEMNRLVEGTKTFVTDHIEKLMKAMADLDKKKLEEKIHPAPSDKPGDVKDTLVACHDLLGCRMSEEEPATNESEMKESIQKAISYCHLALSEIDMKNQKAYEFITNCLHILEQLCRDEQN